MSRQPSHTHGDMKTAHDNTSRSPADFVADDDILSPITTDQHHDLTGDSAVSPAVIQYNRACSHQTQATTDAAGQQLLAMMKKRRSASSILPIHKAPVTGSWQLGPQSTIAEMTDIIAEEERDGRIDINPPPSPRWLIRRNSSCNSDSHLPSGWSSALATCFRSLDINAEPAEPGRTAATATLSATTANGVDQPSVGTHRLLRVPSNRARSHSVDLTGMRAGFSAASELVVVDDFRRKSLKRKTAESAQQGTRGMELQCKPRDNLVETEV